MSSERNGPRPRKVRLEDSRIARHREFRERFPRRAGQRVKSVGFAVLPHDIIEKGAELRVAQLHARIRHRLHQRRQITLGSDRNPGFVENFEVAGLLPEFRHPRFQRLIQCQQADFECFACGDFVDRAAQQSLAARFRSDH